MTGGAALLGARGAMMAGHGGMGAIRAGTAMGSAAPTAYKLGQETSGSASAGAGLGGIATAAGGAASKAAKASVSRVTAPVQASASAGQQPAWNAGRTSPTPAGSSVRTTTSDPALVAQVTEPVCDTVTGRTMLIPQGARLIGSYDSVVAFGQKRALLAWRLLKGVAISTLLGVGTQSSLGSDESDLVRAIRQSTQQSAIQARQQIVTKNLNSSPPSRSAAGGRCA